MRHWSQIISGLNPLTYEVDAPREFMLRNGVSNIGATADLAVLLGALASLFVIAARLYPRTGQ